MLVRLALYKGKGMIGNAMIRWWTRSPYSHCELIVDRVAMSSSLLDGGVRAKEIDWKPEHWDFVDLPWASTNQVLAYYEVTKNWSYSWLDLIRSQVFNHANDEKYSTFCSEWCAAALGLPNPTTFSPQTLGDMCKFLNTFTT